ncbi:MAG TPA: hypothetical protein VMS76_07195, partial [Planctomycetota bacterium]|nr:hypothetical protein [Planctomycetota bacterium]
MSYRTATIFVLAFGAIAPGPALSQGGGAGRDLAGIADEQEILRRQLQRLRLTMEALIPRLEAEGRTHALELLRQGLGFLEERSADSGSLTLDELMDRAREGVQSGQAMQSLESQERIIRGLERLLAILLDRQSLETLQESIEELRELRRELEQLSSREAEIQRATEALREASATPEQQALEAALSEMVERQRELLAENEELGRSSGLFELEAIERQLEELLRRQGVDRAVLESWSPPEREPLARAREPLAAARRSAAQAERLRQAAQLLRESAGTAAQAPASEGLDELKARLETAAEREERHQRASGDD